MTRPKKVLVALSGGVDSAVAALRLRDAGHELAGAYMKNWINEENVFGNCPWEEDIVDARAVAEHLGIDFEVINFMRDYRQRVVDYLVDGYSRGLTPNPDVMCNREMKFGVLLDWARENGFDAVATGHYCRSTEIAGEPALLEGVDKNKDQSYFLSLITPKQLSRAIFPVGHLTKPEVRACAAKAGLPNAAKKDSQGICFIGEVKINDFLEKFIEDKPGEIVNLRGEVFGQHRGLHRFTLGQRRGIGVPSNADNEFYIVVGKDLPNNRLIIAFESDKADAIWRDAIQIQQLGWLVREPPTEPRKLFAKVRYRDPSVPMTFVPLGDGAARLEFAEKQRALAPGQICAIYDHDRLLGGGIYF